jgi:HK97 family phage major capsid protein
MESAGTMPPDAPVGNGAAQPVNVSPAVPLDMTAGITEMPDASINADTAEELPMSNVTHSVELPKKPAKSFSFESDDVLVYSGGAVKDLGEGRIGGYALMFSNAADPDLTKDFFSKDKTIVDGPLADSPVFYVHGKDSKLGKRIIGRAVSAKTDDVGVWLETQLNMRDEYEKAILSMAKAGKLGYSTGALSHLVDREPMGKGVNLIKMWVVGETSLTPTPAEPRLFVQSLKSLNTSEMAALPNEDDKTKPTQNIKEITNMADIDIKAEVAAAFAERDAAEKAKSEKAIADKALEDAGYKKAVDEMKSKKMLKTAPAVIKEIGDDNDGVQAFKSWIIGGQVNEGLIQPDESWSTKVAFNVTTGASGAFLVPDPLLQTIQAKRDIMSWARQAPVQSFVVSADHLLIPAEGTKMTNFTLTAEAAAYTENEATIAAMDLILYKYTKQIRMSEEFVADNATNFDAWLTQALARAVGTTENTIFTNGSGTGAPQGIVTGGTSDATAFTAALLAYAAVDLTTMIGLLPNGYNVPSECGFLMTNRSKWGFKSVGATIFAFIPTPTAGDFFGYPAYVSDDMIPANVTANLVGGVVFANFNQFAIGEKPGILIQRNPYLFMNTGQIAIYANIYRGSVVLQPEAVLLSVNHA